MNKVSFISEDPLQDAVQELNLVESLLRIFSDYIEFNLDTGDPRALTMLDIVRPKIAHARNTIDRYSVS